MLTLLTHSVSLHLATIISHCISSMCRLFGWMFCSLWSSVLLLQHFMASSKLNFRFLSQQPEDQCIGFVFSRPLRFCLSAHNSCHFRLGSGASWHHEACTAFLQKLYAFVYSCVFILEKRPVSQKEFLCHWPLLWLVSMTYALSFLEKTLIQMLLKHMIKRYETLWKVLSMAVEFLTMRSDWFQLVSEQQVVNVGSLQLCRAYFANQVPLRLTLWAFRDRDVWVSKTTT